MLNLHWPVKLLVGTISGSDHFLQESGMVVTRESLERYLEELRLTN